MGILCSEPQVTSKTSYRKASDSEVVLNPKSIQQEELVSLFFMGASRCGF